MYYVYILASDSGTIYIGATNDIKRRIWEHREGLVDGFTKKYMVYKLVYFEQTESVHAALAREKQLKRWNRSKKALLIERQNSEWRDLYHEICA